MKFVNNNSLNKKLNKLRKIKKNKDIDLVI